MISFMVRLFGLGVLGMAFFMYLAGSISFEFAVLIHLFAIAVFAGQAAMYVNGIADKE